MMDGLGGGIGVFAPGRAFSSGDPVMTGVEVFSGEVFMACETALFGPFAAGVNATAGGSPPIFGAPD